jgi:phage tail-like protein
MRPNVCAFRRSSAGGQVPSQPHHLRLLPARPPADLKNVTRLCQRRQAAKQKNMASTLFSRRKERAMANDKSEQQIWPLPKFYFSVQLGDGIEAKFQEVSGLDSETQLIEYRPGDSPGFSPIKMPGLRKFSNVTLRRGIVAADAGFWNWVNEIKMNTIKRRTVMINLLDETGKPTMVWTLNNTWVTKITGPDLKAEGNEIAIESLELAHEGIEVSAP